MLLLLSTALASEIQVTATRPVVVAIDGRPAGVAGTLVDTQDLPAGAHTIQVRNFMGSLLAESRVQLETDERLRLSYDRDLRVLTELDRMPLECDPPGPVLPSSAAASLVITGLSDISGLARVQGAVLPFDSDVQGFLAAGLKDPVVEVHLRDNDQLRFHGAIELPGGQNTVCHLLYKVTAWLVECETSGNVIPQRTPASPKIARDR